MKSHYSNRMITADTVMAPVTLAIEPAWLLVALFLLTNSIDWLPFCNQTSSIAVVLCLCDNTTIIWAFWKMESKAVALASVIQSGHTSVTSTLNRLGELKTEIKHRQVPDGAILPLFRLVGDSVTRFDYVEAGLSMLGHLTKRLVLQEQKELLVAQAIRILPSLVVCFGDRRDRIRQRAAQALSDMWRVSPTDVEQVIRDVALTCESPVIKEAGLRWILKVNSRLRDLDTANLLQAKKDHDMQFKVFVPRIIDCLLDVNGIVRESAKIVVITLFQ